MRRILLGSLLVCACMAQTSEAAIVNFTALLNGLQETPNPVVTLGTGTATATLNDVSGELTISGNFANLTGNTTMAHIHGPALPGVGAGILVPLTIDVGVTSGNFNGAATLTAPQVADMLAGLHYVNVHTSFVGSGEIRGQLLVTAVPEPSSAAVLGLLVGIPAVWRRRR